jgi:hypothetical protein
MPVSERVYNDVSKSVFTIYSIDKNNKKNALGSAVAITKNLLATNCHVALSGNYLIIDVNNEALYGSLFYYDQDKDICIVGIDRNSLIPVNIRRSNTIKIGEEVYAIGSPHGIAKTISKGIISNKEIQDGILTHLQTDASISHGSSGGGLFDKDSNLVGITTSTEPDSENIAFAIPTELILDIINPQKDTTTTQSSTSNKESDATKQHVGSNNESNSNKITRIAYYGRSEIGLMKWRGECFIAILGRYRPDKPTSLAIWLPSTPNGLMIFSRINKAEHAMQEIDILIRTKDIQYKTSKSFMYFDKKLSPLTITVVNDVSQPIYFFSKKGDITEDLITLNYFIGQFYGYGNSSGMTSITFDLDGFTEALAGYNKFCNE